MVKKTTERSAVLTFVFSFFITLAISLPVSATCPDAIYLKDIADGYPSGSRVSSTGNGAFVSSATYSYGKPIDLLAIFVPRLNTLACLGCERDNPKAALATLVNGFQWYAYTGSSWQPWDGQVRTLPVMPVSNFISGMSYHIYIPGTQLPVGNHAIYYGYRTENYYLCYNLDIHQTPFYVNIQ